MSSVVSAMTQITPPTPSHDKVFVEVTASQWIVSCGLRSVSIFFPSAGFAGVAPVDVISMGPAIKMTHSFKSWRD
jgi:hypothetical protein